MALSPLAIRKKIESSFQHHSSSFNLSNNAIKHKEDEQIELQWAAIQKLPTFKRIKTSLLDNPNPPPNHDSTSTCTTVPVRDDAAAADVKKVIDVTKLGEVERRVLIEKLIKHIEHDNLTFLQKQRHRIDRVGVELASIEVRYNNLCVEAECEVLQGNPLPTLWNSLYASFSSVSNHIFKLLCLTKMALQQLLTTTVPCNSQQHPKLTILKDISGIIKPSCLTLLLGPPGCGKTTFLMALAGKLDHTLLKVTGEISYNGYLLHEFVPKKTSAYISQYDLHIPDMTVRETIDFSARCQGVGSRPEIMAEVSRREKEAGIIPDPDIDTYMKAISVEGQKKSIQTEYVMKILGLDICGDIMVGDAMTGGISGGQKKRLTTGEMIVGPAKALFMDEISNGLDCSTTFQIVTCLRQMVHVTDATVVVALLQPAPETFDLFDDVILMAEGKIMYHGPRNYVLNYFRNCGFKCPERKGVADFLQEIISEKDQAQYWCHTNRPYRYVSADQFCETFKASSLGKVLKQEISQPYDKSKGHTNALSFTSHSTSNWALLKACTANELLLTKRNSFVYIFKTIQLTIIAFMTMTMFVRTRMTVDLMHANYFMSALFYTLIRLMTNGVVEMALTVSRLPIFYKQRDFYLYPAWAYAIPASFLKLPFALLESFLWTAITYYVIGYSPQLKRFFGQFLLLFVLNQASTSMCRFFASVFQTMVPASTFGFLILIMMFLFGGFIIPRHSLPPWLRWGFWLSPMSYGEIGISLNEFLAPRWEKVLTENTTIGQQVLTSHGLNFKGYFYWISVGALLGFMLLFDLGFVLALTFLKSPGKSRVIIPKNKRFQGQGKEDYNSSVHLDNESSASTASPACISAKTKSERITLPFEPVTMTFKNVQYYIDPPPEMTGQGFNQKKLRLLSDITGVLRPGILTALMGVSGAGKTTLMDVLSGRKTGGTIEGDIRLGGYPKVQKTFARISGYCEQYDIHSPQITVKESLVFSAWLRLPSEIDSETKGIFVEEVINTVELDDIRDSIVGIPGESGLSTEQRKRLTIAVELVSNPSIIFMDEPTSGLDARAAAVVMRAVKNVVATGRTTVCTIHQPSIDVFEAFDELILMKRGGHVIYSGTLGHHSCELIKYFEGISGVPKIKDNYNPATWMLEVASTSVEAELGLDFSKIYMESPLHMVTIELVQQLSEPPPDSRDLHFTTLFPQNGWVQYIACLWKQHLSYWRSPEYNLQRVMFMIAASTLFGAVFWQKGQKINNEQDLFNILGSMYIAVIFLGINNCSSVLPYVETERTVLYRERFAGMYSSWAYSFAQVTMEIPYVVLQSALFVAITYPAIGYYWTVYKVFWYFYATFCTLLYFVYLGMLIVSLSANVQIASILATAAYTILNLFSGFLMPGPKMPKWWIWCYWICPTSWSLNGLLTSQYGDINEEIMIFGERKRISSFLEEYYGFRHDRLSLVAVVLLAFPVAFASLFAYYIGKINFQKR